MGKISFKAFKQAVVQDLLYAGLTADYFFVQQYTELKNCINKAKGWEEIRWRLTNAPHGLLAFKTYSLAAWNEAIDQKRHPGVLTLAEFIVEALKVDDFNKAREVVADIIEDWVL